METLKSFMVFLMLVLTAFVLFVLAGLGLFISISTLVFILAGVFVVLKCIQLCTVLKHRVVLLDADRQVDANTVNPLNQGLKMTIQTSENTVNIVLS